MKQTLPFIILIFCLNSCTTISRLKGEFVSDIGEKIIIQKKGTLINSKKIKESELIVKQRKNILKFKTLGMEITLCLTDHINYILKY